MQCKLSQSALWQKSEQPVFHLNVTNCNLQESFAVSEDCLNQAVALQVCSMNSLFGGQEGLGKEIKVPSEACRIH